METDSMYVGKRTACGNCIVWYVDDNGRHELQPRYDLVRKLAKQPFLWGAYRQDGLDQLAVALLAHALGDDRAAKRLYRAFVVDVLRPIYVGSWCFTASEIRAWATSGDRLATCSSTAY
jgi:hypothetical protein